MKRYFVFLAFFIAIVSIETNAQRVYHSSGGEVIFSGADVNFSGVDVNTNVRFTLFFHTQQLINLDLTENIGLYTGLAIRNVGLITEDLYQNMGFLNIDETHPDYNKNTKYKRRSYSLGFPIAFKLGSFDKNFFFYGGAEYEWMFHFKQKLFVNDEKRKFTEWTSDRVNSWIPSVFAGIQFPQGFNLKFKYYLDDFLNPSFTGIDFGEDVDYSQFESTGIWYISVAFFINKKQIQKMISGNERTAYKF
ncbi:MAG: hypothetical protein KAR19_17265 [Bacteroidales bacterium]|nr:hypothetical protein [Bacteroidales bacterium]